MNFVNEMAPTNFYAVSVAEQDLAKKGSAGKKAMLIIASAAIALTTGIGAAKICTDCLTECIAYADPIEQVSEAEAPAVGLLAETLKGTSTEA